MFQPSSSAWNDRTSLKSDEARILIVCTGNICRSPFIERLLQHQLDELLQGSEGQIAVRSAGTGALVGSAMDGQAAAQLVAHGGDPTGFRARALTRSLIQQSDLVLTATRAHRGQVAVMSGRALRHAFTFRDFAGLVDDLGESSAPADIGVDADSREWVRHLTEKAAASRGLNPPLEAARADIVDPFRREEEVFATMAQQIVESMPAVVRALAGRPWGR
jgi:protein-tyrosine phosphatase